MGTAISRLFVSRPVTFPVVGITESSFQTIGANHLTFKGSLEDFSVIRIFSLLTNKADIFLVKKRCKNFLRGDLPPLNKEWNSPTYCKTTKVLSQRFNRLH